MLNRLTVSALLKTVILVTSFCVVVGFSLNAWESWGRLQTAGRIAVIADASANIFKAMHNLRTDRSDNQPAAELAMRRWTPRSRNICATSATPRCRRWPTRSASSAAWISLSKQTLVPEFDRAVQDDDHPAERVLGSDGKAEGLAASRRWPRNTWTTASAMLETLEKLSGTLAAAVNHQDAMIDQLLAIKQIAWLLRNTAGEASLIVSVGLSSGKVSPEARLAYTKYSGGIDAAWSALELTASGMQLPPAISSAIATTKTAYFEPSYLALRDRLLTQIAAGEKTELNAEPVDPGHGRTPRCCRRRGRRRARRRQGSRRPSALHSPARAGDATRAARRRARARLRRPDDRRPPRHQAAAHHARRHAEGRGRRPRMSIPATPRATTKSARWPAPWRPSSSRPPTRSGSRRRSANATPAPRRGSRRSRAMSASSRARCARRSASSATLPARCGPPRPVCRRSRARPTSASRSPKRLPARPR